MADSAATESSALLEAGDAQLASTNNGTGSRIEATTRVSPKAVTAIILRSRALVRRLIPSEVAEERITAREGLVTLAVVESFIQIGGDYAEAVPYALLEARKLFDKEANKDDSVLNGLRALACEVIATRIVARCERLFKEQQAQASERDDGHNPAGAHAASSSHLSLSKRYQRIEADGDLSFPSSALETAVDQDCVTFLSSPEAQSCCNALWAGHLVQSFDEKDGSVFFQPFYGNEIGSFRFHFNPGRLAAPRNAYWTSLVLHIALIVVYTLATLEYNGLDTVEVILWVMAAGYLLEDISRWIKIRGLDSLTFWLLVDLLLDALFLTAFSLRVTGWMAHSHEAKAYYQLHAFRTVACIAPLLWIQLLKYLDFIPWFGIIQLLLLRMLKEAAAFFILLILTAIGTAQAFFALDAADGKVSGTPGDIINLLAQGMLGQADFEKTSEGYGQPFGLILYYAYTFVQITLLANILVAFFSSSYDATVGDAESLYRAYLARKVVAAVRAPDQFVYPSPFNIIEVFLVAPLEPFISKRAYKKLNHAVQTVVFFPALVIIAAYESRLDAALVRTLRLELLDDMPGDKDKERLRVAGLEGSVEDPIVPRAAADGLVVSTTPFDRLAARMPKPKADANSDASPATKADVASLLDEIRALREELNAVRAGSAGVKREKEEK